MKNKFTLKSLKESNPDLADKVKEAFELAFNEIHDHILESLRGSESQIAVHGTFVRLVNDETNEIVYVQIRSAFALVFTGLIGTIVGVMIYDHPGEYEYDRDKLTKESREKFGRSSPDPVKEFGGKSVKPKPKN